MSQTRISRPNFFVVGTFKGGTTSLYYYLSQHPEVFMCEPKEPRFFAFDSENPAHRISGVDSYPIRTMDDYLALFAAATSETAIGDASPIYLDSEIAARRIADFDPRARIVASLRDPVARAISGYQMWVRSGRERRGPEAALKPGERWVEGSLYAPKLRRYYDAFPASQIKIVLSEDLSANPAEVMADIYEFLNVSPDFRPDTSVQHNPGGLPRHKLLHGLFQLLKQTGRRNRALKRYVPRPVREALVRVRKWNLERASLPRHIEARLARYYLGDSREVQRLSGLDVSRWKLEERARSGA